jgi:MerR, DNA binding
MNVEGYCPCRSGRPRDTAPTRPPRSNASVSRRLQQLGFTLDEVIDALHATDRGGLTCQSERWRLEAVLDRIDNKIAELGAARHQVQAVMSACDKRHLLVRHRPANTGTRGALTASPRFPVSGRQTIELSNNLCRPGPPVTSGLALETPPGGLRPT